jgi:glycosyltransferase involved in cell wall biosynthesis
VNKTEQSIGVAHSLKNRTKTIWLLSAYRSDSHASWAGWLSDTFSEFRWQRLELPGRHFRWRIRGNPLSWLHRLPEQTPDLILATSMVDLSTLKGLHPRLAVVPCLYYFHENQFAYPVSTRQFDSVDPQMVQLYGALAADRVLFNSPYNRDSFLQGVTGLLEKLPDEIPEGVVEILTNKSHVLPVVIVPVKAKAAKNEKLILWNHRWEYDKQPQVFCDALLQLNKNRPDFKLALLGHRPAKKPAALLEIEQKLDDKIIINGKVSRDEYEKYLSQSAIVVSTANHEFQGLAILEAVSAGAVPLVPDDLCYREQYAEEYRYQAGDSFALAEKLSLWLKARPQTPEVSYWYSEEIIDNWYQVLKEF